MGAQIIALSEKTKFIPFETVEEFLIAQEKHGYKVLNKIGIPFNCYVNIHRDDDGDVCLSFCGCLHKSFSFSKLFEKFTFNDGTPFGKEVVLFHAQKCGEVSDYRPAKLQIANIKNN